MNAGCIGSLFRIVFNFFLKKKEERRKKKEERRKKKEKEKRRKKKQKRKKEERRKMKEPGSALCHPSGVSIRCVFNDTRGKKKILDM